LFAHYHSTTTIDRCLLLPTYDSTGVTERHDESLNVIVVLFQFEPTDVVVRLAQQSSDDDDANDIGKGSEDFVYTGRANIVKVLENANEKNIFIRWCIIDKQTDGLSFQ